MPADAAILPIRHCCHCLLPLRYASYAATLISPFFRCRCLRHAFTPRRWRRAAMPLLRFRCHAAIAYAFRDAARRAFILIRHMPCHLTPLALTPLRYFAGFSLSSSPPLRHYAATPLRHTPSDTPLPPLIFLLPLMTYSHIDSYFRHATLR